MRNAMAILKAYFGHSVVIRVTAVDGEATVKLRLAGALARRHRHAA